MVDYGGRPIILAGQGVYDPYHNHAEYYNGLSWVDFPPLPINVRYHSAVTDNKYIWVFGGYYYRNAAAVNVIPSKMFLSTFKISVKSGLNRLIDQRDLSLICDQTHKSGRFSPSDLSPKYKKGLIFIAYYWLSWQANRSEVLISHHYPVGFKDH